MTVNNSTRCSPTAPAPMRRPAFRNGAGIRDYLTYVNDAQGGVDGVKVFVQECETAYTLERGSECYERC